MKKGSAGRSFFREGLQHGCSKRDSGFIRKRAGHGGGGKAARGRGRRGGVASAVVALVELQAGLYFVDETAGAVLLDVGGDAALLECGNGL